MGVMKKGSVKWFLIFLLTLTLVVGTEIFEHHWRMANSHTVSAVCEVVDKHKQRSSNGPGYRGAGTGSSLRYFLVLSFSDGQITHETTIQTTSQGFENAKIGDSALCEVTYDQKGILDILVLDTSVDHYTWEEQITDWLWGLGIVGGIIAVLAGLAFFLPDDFKEKKEGTS